MADEESLDAFLDAKVQKSPQRDEPQDVSNIEDEFAKLLNDFLNQDKKTSLSSEKPAVPETKPEKTELLDSFIENTGSGLDSFVTGAVETAASENNNIENLDSMLTNTPEPESQAVAAEPLMETELSRLKPEEQELARAISNFQDGVYALADKKNLKMPLTDYNEEQLIPNYKPRIGKKIAQYLLACWDVINKYDPESMKSLSKDADDEEYLTFAESLNDTDMQLAIISYVEILINLEICEVSYEQKREIIQKNRIKRELYEEYKDLQQRKALFIKKLKEKNFPIDVDKLINNYFRVAQKDADGSFDALVKNPAMFSPIEFDKITPKFFGLIKVAPEDGVKANQKIGKFIKKLKV